MKKSEAVLKEFRESIQGRRKTKRKDREVEERERVDCPAVARRAKEKGR